MEIEYLRQISGPIVLFFQRGIVRILLNDFNIRADTETIK
jgi:hypothetical protein